MAETFLGSNGGNFGGCCARPFNHIGIAALETEVWRAKYL